VDGPLIGRSDELLDCVKRLADAVLVELGERRAKAAKRVGQELRPLQRPAPSNLRVSVPMSAAMLRIAFKTIAMDRTGSCAAGRRA
jgi:hypothetical protein